MPAPPEVIAARQLNQVKYVVEDFDDGVKDLVKVIVILAVLALAMVVSLLFDANNGDHLGFTLVQAGVIYVFSRQNLLDRNRLFMLTFSYFAQLGLEAVMSGMPDLLVPFLNAGEWRGFPVFVNHLTPFVYWGVKLMAGLWVLRLWLLRQKVYAQPEELLRKAGIANRI